jgi:hypothetical protein
MLHLTNGDVVAGLLRDARLPGTIIPWQDVLHEGPVPWRISHEELRDVRAKFLADCGWAPYEAVYGMFAARDRELTAVGGAAEVVLWFERDLYDQLQLIQILDRIGTRRASFVDLGEPRRLGVVKVLSLYEKREPLTAQQREVGREAWRAFTSPDPTAIEHVIDHGVGPLPALEPALLRHLQEYPSVENGLSRTERQTLVAIANGAGTREELFPEVAAREQRPFLGDSSFWLYLARLAAGRNPLITESNGALTLTDAGQDVLERKEDNVRLNGIDRWLGGVHLSGEEAEWRWDAAAGRLRRRELE